MEAKALREKTDLLQSQIQKLVLAFVDEVGECQVNVNCETTIHNNGFGKNIISPKVRVKIIV